MTKRGNVILGAGCYAAALESTADNNKIIKVGTSTSDMWLAYYYEICSVNKGVTCIPRIYSFHKDEENEYYVAVMEKLYMYHDSDTEKAKSLVRNYVSGSISRDEWLDEAVMYPKQFNHLGQFLHVMNEIRDRSSEEDPDECEFIDDYRAVDLHSANMLSRSNGQLVITDPWCNHPDLMDELQDVGEWATETLGYYE